MNLLRSGATALLGALLREGARRRICPVAALIALASVFAPVYAPTFYAAKPSSVFSDEDVAVYRALIAATLPSTRQEMVVQRETVPDEAVVAHLQSAATKSALRGLPSELTPDLEARNRAPLQLRFEADRTLRFVNRAGLDGVFKSGGWAAFHKKYTKAFGVASFSLPTFNADRTAALVYFAHAEGGKSGSSAVYYLRKVAGKWKIARVFGLSMA